MTTHEKPETLRTAEEALDTVFAVAAEQCEMLAAAARNPDVDATDVRRLALEYLLRATRVEAAESAVPSAPRFRHAVSLVERLTRDVQLSAFDLCADWSCPACGESVPGRFFVQAVRARNPAVSVECAACNATASLTEQGRTRFRAVFADNLAMDWNPRFNNFEWDGT